MFFYENIQKLNNTELQIYKYIMDNQDKIQYMTIRELANKTHVSTATILRFCSKLDCDSYRNFKEAFKKHRETAAATPPRSDLKEILNYFQGVNTCAFEKELEQGAAILRKAKTIIFHGIGSSGMIANYAARYFTIIGKSAWANDDVCYPVVNETTSETALFILSESGESSLVIQHVNAFLEYQSKVLSITNTTNCTIAKMSDWNISYNIQKHVMDNHQNATSQVPVIFILEALARRI